MYLIGVQTIKPMIGDIQPDSIAGQAGVVQGSVIKRVGERETIDWQAVNLELISYIGNDTLPLTVTLPNSPVEQTKVLNLSTWQFNPDEDSAIDSLGLSVYRPEILNVVGLVAEKSAAEQLGLQVGDKIQQVDGTPMKNWEQIVSYVAKRPNADIAIEVLRDERVVRLNGMLGSRQDGENEIGYLGVSPTLAPWPKGVLFTHQYGLFDAIVQASDKTWRLMTLSVEMLGKLITGDVSVKNLSGPISIAQGAGMSASSGIVYFLSFLALISVNLGIINLLPIPVLDGGHLLYYFIELLRGRPVPDSVQEIGFKIGGVLLLLFMSIAIINDITRL